MSEQTNKNDSNKRLRDFLDKNKDREQAEDAFEKEALEGFSMLEGENDALELKAALDDKMKQRFLNTESSKNFKRYWLAAAALLIVSGFSVYFVGNSSSEPGTLAITPTDTHVELRSEQAAPLSDHNSGPPEAPLNNNPRVLKNKDEETFKPNKSERSSAKAKEPAPVTAVPTEESPAAGKADVTEKFEEDKLLEIPAEAIKTAQQPAEKDVALTREKKNSVASGAKSKSAASPKPMAHDNNDKEVLNEIEDALTAPYYVLGEEALKQNLKKSLVKKECDQKFEAALVIGKNGKVEKAEILKAYALTTSQQKQVIKILLSLQGFSQKKAGSVKSSPVFKLFYPG